jgi:GT2 family glycosyltransferase
MNERTSSGANGSRVTIITVSYNSHEVLPDMLASVPQGVSVVIVDNGSRNIQSLRQIALRYEATLVESPTNIGFSRACNLGAARANTEFLFFLNPDARLANDALDRMIESASHFSRASAFNPRITGINGRPFFKGRSDLLPRSRWIPQNWPDDDCEINTLSGAALLVRRDAFEQVGGFDDQLFLFYEDDDLAIRLESRCGPLMFVRDASVTHGAGSSSGPSASISGFKAWNMGFSKVHACRKHRGLLFAGLAVATASIKAMLAIPPMSVTRRLKRIEHLKGAIHAFVGGRCDACLARYPEFERPTQGRDHVKVE